MTGSISILAVLAPFLCFGFGLAHEPRKGSAPKQKSLVAAKAKPAPVAKAEIQARLLISGFVIMVDVFFRIR